MQILIWLQNLIAPDFLRVWNIRYTFIGNQKLNLHIWNPDARSDWHWEKKVIYSSNPYISEGSRVRACYHWPLIHCSKHLRDQTFKAIHLEIYWEKSFQIVVLVVLFSRIIVLDNAVVAEKKLAKLYFLHNPEGNHPQNTSASEPLRSWPLTFQTRSNTITLSIVKSVPGVATDLTISYAKFAPLNVWNFAPLHVFIMLR